MLRGAQSHLILLTKRQLPKVPVSPVCHLVEEDSSTHNDEALYRIERTLGIS